MSESKLCDLCRTMEKAESKYNALCFIKADLNGLIMLEKAKKSFGADNIKMFQAMVRFVTKQYFDDEVREAQFEYEEAQKELDAYRDGVVNVEKEVPHVI